MRYFYAKNGGWDNVLRSIRRNKILVIFLDYDGTITEIRSKPEDAVIDFPTKKLLRNLANHPRVRIGIVTGRAFDDIRKMVGIEGIIYIANHGFEIKLYNKVWIHPEARRRGHLLLKLARSLRGVLKNFPGAIVEDKGLNISVHYRNMRYLLVFKLKDEVLRLIKPYKGKLKLKTGKKVIEICPSLNWDKGKAVLKVLKEFGFKKKPLIIYAGDDRTDEDAFSALKRCGITIRVGRKKKTFARYYLKNSSEVRLLLNRISQVLEPEINSKESKIR